MVTENKGLTKNTKEMRFRSSWGGSLRESSWSLRGNKTHCFYNRKAMEAIMEASLREPPWSLHGHKKHSCSVMEALMDAGLCGIHAQIITQYSFLIPRFGSADGVSAGFRFS